MTNKRAVKIVNSPYTKCPDCVLLKITSASAEAESYCAGFEMSKWWCDGLADNLIEWIIDYALKSDELKSLDHTNTYVRLRQAAARVYTSPKYSRRGEVGEIAAHAVCRKYFGTIPIAPRLNYLSASNDPIKAFDLVHVRYIDNDDIELWLGEAKFFKNRNDAITDAISSVKSHIDKGFLKNEKLLLGPQISNDIPHSEKIKALFSSEVSLDKLIKNAVFPIFIVANSDATSEHTEHCEAYADSVKLELVDLSNKIAASGLQQMIKIFLIYVPLGDKDSLSKAFDSRLKGLQIQE